MLAWLTFYISDYFSPLSSRCGSRWETSPTTGCSGQWSWYWRFCGWCWPSSCLSRTVPGTALVIDHWAGVVRTARASCPSRTVPGTALVIHGCAGVHKCIRPFDDHSGEMKCEPNFDHHLSNQEGAAVTWVVDIWHQQWNVESYQSSESHSSELLRNIP